jgi:hypothetical protein
VPEYRVGLEDRVAETSRAVAYDAHLGYRSLLKDLMLECGWLGGAQPSCRVVGFLCLALRVAQTLTLLGLLPSLIRPSACPRVFRCPPDAISARLP